MKKKKGACLTAVGVLLAAGTVWLIREEKPGQPQKEEVITVGMDTIADVTELEETEETPMQEPISLTAVMDRILEKTKLRDAIPAEDMIQYTSGDQLFLYDRTQDGVYSLYGFHSEEYDWNGLLLNYELEGIDNWNYLHEEIPDLELSIKSAPRLDETPEGGVALAYQWGSGTGVLVERFYYLTPYETGTLDVREFTGEEILKQLEDLIELRMNAEKQEVQVYSKETNAGLQLIAVLPYPSLLDTETVTSVVLLPDWIHFLTAPQTAIVGVGVNVEGWVQPLLVGELAAQICEEDGELILRNAGTYDEGLVQ